MKKIKIINISYCSSPNFDDLLKFTQTNLLKIDKIKKDFTVELIFKDDIYFINFIIKI